MRIAITLGVVVALAVLWVVDDRLSHRPWYQERTQRLVEGLAERRRARGFRRPTFVIWAVLSGVVLLALLWAAH